MAVVYERLATPPEERIPWAVAAKDSWLALRYTCGEWASDASVGKKEVYMRWLSGLHPSRAGVLPEGTHDVEGSPTPARAA